MTVTRRLIMQKARRHPKAPSACKRMVSSSISPSYSLFFSPFPHGTSPLSVSNVYLALADGAAGFHGYFSGPRLLRIHALIHTLPVRGSHPLWPTFPNRSSSVFHRLACPTTPVTP